MKINITKKQYKRLIEAVSIANGIVGVLGDVSRKTDYKKHSNEIEELEKYFLQFADDFGCGHLADEDMYEDHILPIIDDYEDYATHDCLANKLAWRDFRKDYSEKEINEMSKESNGYLGPQLYKYEKKYWDEFEKNEFERLEIKE
ncbi:hypothetical protein KAU19_03705 [Candidatus Parcubacteria bacterium]|nr:hypothetical protein [Candidatus Parcubacteria bacterium]